MSDPYKKKYQVFISSTFSDLEAERLSIMKAMMGIDCIPAGMEDFPAFDEAQLSYIKRVIDESDYYILIIGGRYGSQDEDGISFTEKEFQYAREKKKPILAFINSDVGSLLAKHIDDDHSKRAKLERFKEEVKRSRIVKFWTRSEELPGLALIALNQAIRLVPQIGWARGDSLEVQQLVSELSQRRQENHILRSEIEKRDIEIGELRDVLGRDADDASGLYSKAAAIAAKGDQIETGDRESIRLLLERIVKLALELKVPPNDLYNSGIAAANVDLDYLSLQLHTLAHHSQDSLSHLMARLHRETSSGVRLLIVSGNEGLEIQRDTSATSQAIRKEALNATLAMFADAPVAQCEIVYSQGWNICQVHRESGASELALSLLTASYYARINEMDKIEEIPDNDLLSAKIDWSKQIGKPVPSYLLQKIAEFTMFLSKHDWMDHTKHWIRLAERQNAIEPPNATWYESTVMELNKSLAMIRAVEARIAQQIDI
ncbi:DUF4062 domain-containing protein [Aquabacterium sp. A3]|uniref:DUF4062 domain-containing protein n=1 Tax=Aquabacterium sp. A3 TaxID=3132829 RepID=UPI00311933B9